MKKKKIKALMIGECFMYPDDEAKPQEVKRVIQKGENFVQYVNDLGAMFHFDQFNTMWESEVYLMPMEDETPIEKTNTAL